MRREPPQGREAWSLAGTPGPQVRPTRKSNGLQAQEMQEEKQGYADGRKMMRQRQPGEMAGVGKAIGEPVGRAGNAEKLMATKLGLGQKAGGEENGFLAW